MPWSSDNRPIIVPPSTESLGKRNHDLRNRSTGVYQQYPTEGERSRPQSHWRRDDGAFAKAARQLTAYFAGDLTRFDLPLHITGTDFRRRVWSELQTIPYGETISYAALANRIGRPRAFRAVGAANGANPLPIVVPCHRVIGSDGSLTGFGGGIEVKRFLLGLEGVAVGHG